MREDATQYIPNKFEFSRFYRVIRDLVRGFHTLDKYCLAVTFFGSARCGLESDVYQTARSLAHKLASDGFTVITGGGPGIMQAANHGAKEAGGNSVGLNIKLPKEQKPNPYVTDETTFHYFFTRKVCLAFASEVYVFFPGGFGTMDEFFEIITLIQTKRMQKIPVILVDKSYWTPLLEWIEQTMCDRVGTISREDMDIYTLVDTADEAYEFIKKHAEAEELKPC